MARSAGERNCWSVNAPTATAVFLSASKNFLFILAISSTALIALASPLIDSKGFTSSRLPVISDRDSSRDAFSGSTTSPLTAAFPAISIKSTDLTLPPSFRYLAYTRSMLCRSCSEAISAMPIIASTLCLFRVSVRTIAGFRRISSAPLANCDSDRAKFASGFRKSIFTRSLPRMFPFAVPRTRASPGFISLVALSKIPASSARSSPKIAKPLSVSSSSSSLCCSTGFRCNHAE